LGVKDKLRAIIQMNTPNTDNAIGLVDSQRILVIR
jgi:hypothetical protein